MSKSANYYCVLLTILVIVAYAEKKISKSKLLKFYLQTIMTQNKLNGLAILCIKKDEIEDLEYDDIIHDFGLQIVLDRGVISLIIELDSMSAITLSKL